MATVTADLRLTARQGDTLDALLWREASLGPAAIAPVLAANPGLADLGTVLPKGTVIALPATVTTTTGKQTRSLIQLWD
ncbi:MAG: tail protein X [Rhizomicrobium sp.]